MAKGIAKGRQNPEHSHAEPATAGSIGISQLRRMIVVITAMLSVEPNARTLPVMLLPPRVEESFHQLEDDGGGSMPERTMGLVSRILASIEEKFSL
jgi:hypothetical protein